MATQCGPKLPNTPRTGQATGRIEIRNEGASSLLVLRIKIPLSGPTANASGSADRQPCNRGSPSRVAASVLEPRPPYWVRLACIWPAHSRRQSGLRAGLVYLSADCVIGAIPALIPSGILKQKNPQQFSRSSQPEHTSTYSTFQSDIDLRQNRLCEEGTTHRW
jgi:hypothetical protein